jgi:hypothetical protein
MANPVAYLTTNALSFEGEGDFIIENNDLKVLETSLKVRVAALRDLLKSNYGDYFYIRNLAGDLDKFLGRGIDAPFQLEVENHVKNVIINSSLFEETEFNIYSLVDINTIYLRIFIAEGTNEEETIDLTYQTETGVSLG